MLDAPAARKNADQAVQLNGLSDILLVFLSCSFLSQIPVSPSLSPVPRTSF